MKMNQVNDMITRMRNAQKAGLIKVLLYKPTSQLCINILYELKQQGFIENYTVNFLKNRQTVVFLKLNSVGLPVMQNIRIISKPGRRVYIKNKHLWNIKQGQGIFILSTPHGIMSHIYAKLNNYGGEILLQIY